MILPSTQPTQCISLDQPQITPIHININLEKQKLLSSTSDELCTRVYSILSVGLPRILHVEILTFNVHI
jgi:hypothetical protein